MVNRQDHFDENTYYIGFDLCDDDSFISYWDDRKQQPQSINTTGGYGSEQIPTVVGYNSNTKEWLVGQEAMLNEEQEGIYYINNFVEKLGDSTTYRIDHKEYSVVDIVAVFFKETLDYIKKINPNSFIGAIMVTTQKVTGCSNEAITEALERYGIPKGKIYVQSYLESGVSYIVSENLPQKRAGIFNLTQTGLQYYQISMQNLLSTLQIQVEEVDMSHLLNGESINNIVKDYIAELFKVMRKKVELTEEEEALINHVYYRNRQFIFSKLTQNQKANIYFNSLYPPVRIELSPDVLVRQIGGIDLKFEKISEEILQNNLVTALFLVGSGFGVPWANQSLKSLVRGRRVFQGQNLFCHGACYSIGVIQGVFKQPKLLVVGKGIIETDYGIQVNSKKDEVFVPIIKAGTPWYSADASVDVLLDEMDEILIVEKESNTKYKTVCSVKLNNLPRRPNKTSKVNIHMQFASEEEGRVEVTDLGLGQIFPGSYRKWEQKFKR